MPAPESPAAPPVASTDPNGAPAIPSARSVLAVLLAVQVGFASWSIVGRVTVHVVPPLLVVYFRIAGGALVFALLSLLSGRSAVPPRAVLGETVRLAILGLLANMSLFTVGLRHTSAIEATALVATIPLVAGLYAVLSGRERNRAALWIGTLIAAAGVLLVIRPSRAAGFASHAFGNLLIVLNGISYAAYLVRVRASVKQFGSDRVIAWVFLVAAVIATPFGAVLLWQHAASLDARAWLAVAYIVLVPTAFTYAGNAYALGRVQSTTVAAMVYLQPVLAVVMALTVGPPLAAFLHVAVPAEVFTATMAAGMVATLFGVWVATRT